MIRVLDDGNPQYKDETPDEYADDEDDGDYAP